MIIDEIITAVTPRASGHTVTHVSLGAGYTAVCLDDNSCGAAYTLRTELGSGCSIVKEAGTIAGRPASELITWARDVNLARAAVGLATVNALCPPGKGCEYGNALTAVDIKPDDRVGMIGYFQPIVHTLRQRKQKLLIFERHPAAEALPDWAVEMELGTCDVVVITATALLNKTIDRLLQLSKGAREVAVIGPSVPFLPDIFSTYGVTLLGGVQVLDPTRMLQITAEGGGARSFGTATAHVYIRLEGRRS